MIMSLGWVLLPVVLLMAGLAMAAEERRDALGDPLPPNATQRLGTLKLRYGSVGGLAYLPDGRVVIADGGAIYVWNLSEGGPKAECVQRAKVSSAAVCAVQVRSDGGVLLIGDVAGRVREWDVSRMAEVRGWDTGINPLCSVRYSPDEKRMLVAGGVPPLLAEWDLQSGKKLIEIKSEMAQTSFGGIYGPAGKTAILGGGYEHNLEHYDLATGRLLKKWCSMYQAKRMALSPDEKYLLMGVEDRAVEWSLETYEVFRFYKHCPGEAARILSVAYVPQTNEVLCGGRDGSIHRWNRATGERVFSWTPHQSIVAPICVSADQKWVLSYGTGLVAETNIATGEPRVKWDRHNGAVQGAAMLPSGKQALSASTDATLRLWDIATGSCSLTIAGAHLGAYAVDVSPDGSRAVAGCKDGKVREFTLADGKLLREMAGHLGFVRSVKYTRKGDRILSSADDGSIRVWGAQGSEALAVLQGHQGGVLSISIAPDDKTVVSGGRDGTVRIWDLPTGKCLGRLDDHRGYVECVTISPDGRYAFSGGRDGRILKWDMAAGKTVAEFLHGSWLRALACSGSRLASSGDGREIICWDADTGARIQTFSGHSGQVGALALSGDGKTLVSGSQDTTLLVWQCP